MSARTDKAFSKWAASELAKESARRDLAALEAASGVAGWKSEDELMRLPWPPCCAGLRARRLLDFPGGFVDLELHPDVFRCVHGLLLDAPVRGV